MEKAQVYDFNHGTTGQKLYETNHSEQRQCCGGEINLQCTIFHVIFTTHLPTDIIKCLQEMLVQSVSMEQTRNTQFHAHENYISKHFTRNKLLCLLQAGRSHVVICNDLRKEVWMSDISSECPGTQWCNSNCFCPSISIQGRNFDTNYHKFNLVSKFNGINQKVA